MAKPGWRAELRQGVLGKFQQTPARVRRLETFPNIGKAVADILRRIGIATPVACAGRDLRMVSTPPTQRRQRDPQRPLPARHLHRRHPFHGGEPARPWWAYTAERKARLGGGDSNCRGLKLCVSPSRPAWSNSFPTARPSLTSAACKTISLELSTAWSWATT